MTGAGWEPSAPLFDTLADDYDDHFAAPHRAAYDTLAWDAVVPLLPAGPGVVVDAGCGSGRWAARLITEGHRVIGIESAPRMVAAARARLSADPSFTLVEGDMGKIEHPALARSDADVVLAMGSLQYAPDVASCLERFARWLRPGGSVAVLVDSLVALVLELWAQGRVDEAETRACTRTGRWEQLGRTADLHLFDRTTLEMALRDAGLVDVEVRGLLVGATALGRDRLAAALEDDAAAFLDVERRFAGMPALADAGKQLLAVGRRPAGP